MALFLDSRPRLLALIAVPIIHTLKPIRVTPLKCQLAAFLREPDWSQVAYSTQQ